MLRRNVTAIRYRVKALGRPREHDAATRERLLTAAAALAGDEGWDAVTVRRVAERADTTTRAVYSLFGSKRGLEEELHLAMYERLRELMAATPATGDPRSDLLEMRHAYRQWATERPERYAAMMQFIGPRAVSRSPRGLRLARAAETELREAFVRCAEGGLIDAAHVDSIATRWRAVAHGLAEFENHGLLEDGDDSWYSVLTAVIDGYTIRGSQKDE
jgi:AcrR family transcriptional regulator